MMRIFRFLLLVGRDILGVLSTMALIWVLMNYPLYVAITMGVILLGILIGGYVLARWEQSKEEIE